MKKLITTILLSALLFPSFSIATVKKATLINPAGHRKVVIVGQPGIFAGGYILERKFGTAIPDVVATFETSLASRLSSTATSSMTLVSGTTGDSTTLNGFYGFVIDEGNTSEEFILATCVSTACTGLTRGISTETGTSSVTALQKEHRRGASVKMTDHPVLKTIINILTARGTLPSKLTYASQPSITSDEDLATKKYADDLSLAGAPDATETVKGNSELSTNAEAAAGTSAGGTGARLVLPASMATSTGGYAQQSVPVTGSNGKLAESFTDFSLAKTFTATTTLATTTVDGLLYADSGNIVSLLASTTITGSTTPQPVYVSSTTGAVLLSDANDDATWYDFIGFAISSAVSGGSVYVQTSGIVKGFTGLTTGREYYVSNNVGALSIASGTVAIKVGIAVSPTKLLIRRVKQLSYPKAMTSAVNYIAYADAYITCYDNPAGNATSNTYGYLNGNVVLKSFGLTASAVNITSVSFFASRGDVFSCAATNVLYGSYYYYN